MNKFIATATLGVLTAGAFALSVVPKAIAYQSATPLDSTETLTQDSHSTVNQGSPNKLKDAQETVVAGTYVCDWVQVCNYYVDAYGNVYQSCSYACY
jgi:hypothetical protein